MSNARRTRKPFTRRTYTCPQLQSWKDSHGLEDLTLDQVGMLMSKMHVSFKDSETVTPEPFDDIILGK